MKFICGTPNVIVVKLTKYMKMAETWTLYNICGFVVNFGFITAENGLEILLGGH